MVLLEDTRQQVGKHRIKRGYFAERGITVERCKLYVGDYAIASRQDVAVDTKKDLLELVSDVTTEHERFRSECERARDAGVLLVVLVENLDGVGKLEDVKEWVNPRTYDPRIGLRKAGDGKFYRFRHGAATSGQTLYKILKTMQGRYGVKFLFCEPLEAGERILEILGWNDEG